MTVEVERIGRILVISIQREEKRNALNAEITAAVDAAMNELEDDPDLWCGVLTGTATVFSAGADLGAGTGGPTPAEARSAWSGGPHEPLIAAVEGYAVGGGMELVLSCDLVVASRTASFGLPEVKRGSCPTTAGRSAVCASFHPMWRASCCSPASSCRRNVPSGSALSTASPNRAARAPRRSCSPNRFAPTHHSRFSPRSPVRTR